MFFALQLNFFFYIMIFCNRTLNIPRFPTISVELWLPAASALPADKRIPAAERSALFVLSFMLSPYL